VIVLGNKLVTNELDVEADPDGAELEDNIDTREEAPSDSPVGRAGFV
jgi:hypothetical protein